jgi:hypothetical protein
MTVNKPPGKSLFALDDFARVDEACVVVVPIPAPAVAPCAVPFPVPAPVYTPRVAVPLSVPAADPVPVVMLLLPLHFQFHLSW